MRAPKGLEKAGPIELGANAIGVGVNPFLPDSPAGAGTSKEVWNLLERFFSKDMSKVMPEAKSAVPAAPDLKAPFMDYLEKIGKLLGR